MPNSFAVVMGLLFAMLVMMMWIVPNNSGSHLIMPGLLAHDIGDGKGTLSTRDDDGLVRQHEEIDEAHDLGRPVRSSKENKGKTVESKDYHTEAATISLQQLHSGAIDVSKFAPNEYALVQYDSRELQDYWLASAAWNREYCKQHGHTYIYYSLKPNEKCLAVDGKELLADAWCKVKAMLTAQAEYPHVKIFIYMDSDAVIAKKFKDMSLNAMSNILQEKLSWDISIKPIIFNQDGPCWWCNQVKKVGYTTCLNAGTVMWYNHPYSKTVLQNWWNAALDSYEGDGNPFHRKFRIKWPWEQDRQMAVYHRDPSHIQVASQPEQMHIDMEQDWCLSHLARASCYIAHHCEDKKSKKNMMNMYTTVNTASAAHTLSIGYLEQEREKL